MHLPASNEPERLCWNRASSVCATAGSINHASATPRLRPKRIRSRPSPPHHRITNFLNVGVFHFVPVMSLNHRLILQLLLETAVERRCHVAVSGATDRLCPPRLQLRCVYRWF